MLLNSGPEAYPASLLEFGWNVNADEAFEILNRYEARFGRSAPHPMHVEFEDVASVALRYLDKGRPIPDTYDWYPDLPDGALI